VFPGRAGGSQNGCFFHEKGGPVEAHCGILKGEPVCIVARYAGRRGGSTWVFARKLRAASTAPPGASSLDCPHLRCGRAAMDQTTALPCGALVRLKVGSARNPDCYANGQEVAGKRIGNDGLRSHSESAARGHHDLTTA
jgi:hypothetical protein